MIWTSQAVFNALHRLTDATDTVLLESVIQATGLKNRKASDACGELVAKGFLARVRYANGAVKPGVYTLTADGRYALEAGAKLTSGRRGPMVKSPTNQNSLRDRVWRLLRIRRKLSTLDAVALLLDGAASEREQANAMNNVQTYLCSLRRAGYLTEMRRGPSMGRGNGFKRYLLARDCGPLAPVYRCKDKTVYDPNTGDLHELA